MCRGSVKSAIDSIARPDARGVASVMSVIKPGKGISIRSWRWAAIAPTA